MDSSWLPLSRSTGDYPFEFNAWSRSSLWSNFLNACENFKPNFEWMKNSPVDSLNETEGYWLYLQNTFEYSIAIDKLLTPPKIEMHMEKTDQFQ